MANEEEIDTSTVKYLIHEKFTINGVAERSDIIGALFGQTEGLIGEEQIKLMKSTAYIINISRGRIIDEEALIRALQNNSIAGAGLEAFNIEPLPSDSPLWDLANVIFNPHCGGGGNLEDLHTRLTDLFCENLTRYLRGDDLTNTIDRVRGY